MAEHRSLENALLEGHFRQDKHELMYQSLKCLHYTAMALGVVEGYQNTT